MARQYRVYPSIKQKNFPSILGGLLPRIILLWVQDGWEGQTSFFFLLRPPGCMGVSFFFWPFNFFLPFPLTEYQGWQELRRSNAPPPAKLFWDNWVGCLG